MTDVNMLEILICGYKTKLHKTLPCLSIKVTVSLEGCAEYKLGYKRQNVAE